MSVALSSIETLRGNRRCDTSLTNLRDLTNVYKNEILVETSRNRLNTIQTHGSISRNRCISRTDSIGPSKNQLSPKNTQKIIQLPSKPFYSNRSRDKR